MESRYGLTMLSRSDELEAMKRIDLCQYVASCGYVLDRRQSSKCSAVMRHPNGDKLIIARVKSGHFVYMNAKGSDKGSIIDFVQARDRLSLGEVRKKLRPWLKGGSALRTRLPEAPIEIQPSDHDAASVLAAWLQAKPIDETHPYLEQDRCIPRWVLQHPKFHDRIRIDARGNVVFPHFNREGICGFEMKNRGWTGFSPGGVKGLACSRAEEGDCEMVICETAIDMLSLAALEGVDGRRFFSTAGRISPLQEKLLLSAVEKIPEKGRILMAFDNDEGGRKLARQLRAVIPDPAGRVVDHFPIQAGQDWNEVLACRPPKINPDRPFAP